MTSADLERLTRTAYEAYRGTRSASEPPWEDLSADQKEAWRAAVSAATGQGDVTLTDSVPRQSIVVKAENQTHVFRYDFTAGRQGNLAVSDDHASSHHARFQFAHSSWYVEDLGSTNGTFLNGRRIYAAQRLKKGDKIRIGRTVMVVMSA